MTIRIPKVLLIVVLLLLVGGGAAIAGYFYGESTVDEKAVKERAYAHGHSDGFKEGKRIGEGNAAEQSFDEYDRTSRLGSKLALDPAYFDAGNYYVIRISDSYPKGEASEWNANSLEMEDGKSYYVCGSTDICFSEGE